MTNNEKIDKMLMFFHGTRTLKDLLLEMAEWKQKQMVEKTIQWLATHAELYGGFNSGRLNDMVEAFKKDMENTKN